MFESLLQYKMHRSYGFNPSLLCRDDMVHAADVGFVAEALLVSDDSLVQA